MLADNLAQFHVDTDLTENIDIIIATHRTQTAHISSCHGFSLCPNKSATNTKSYLNKTLVFSTKFFKNKPFKFILK